MAESRTDSLSRAEESFFCLLRAGLWMNKPELALFPLAAAEWEEVYSLAVRHTVTGLVFQGFCLLPDSLMPPHNLVEEWVADIDRIEQRNVKMNHAVESLFAFFEQQGLSPVLLKGQGLANMYVHPLQRSCGDIDLYFKTHDECKNALSVVKSRGVCVREMSDGAFEFMYKGFVVEIHQKLLDIYNPICHRTVRKLVEQEGFDGRFPANLVNLMLLNTHILKHVIGPGIGLRQIADMARAYYVLDGKYDKPVYWESCHKLHIDHWSKQLHVFLREYMGLPMEMLPKGSCDEFVQPKLLRLILQGGSFGKFHETGDKDIKSRGAFYTLRHSFSHLPLSLKLSVSETIFYLLRLILGQFQAKSQFK